MKFSSVILTVFALVSTGLAAKSCTPSFDYCSDLLINSKGELLFPGMRHFQLIEWPRLHGSGSKGCPEGN